MAYPFLYSVASSILQKLDNCNLDELEIPYDTQNDVEMLKGILTHLPSILETHKSMSDFYAIQSSVYDLHGLLNKQLHPSSAYPIWRQLVDPLARFQDHKHPQSSDNSLLSCISYALPNIRSQDVEVELPSQLVPCLAYCALYPSGYRLVRETVVNLWMAEGFLELQTAAGSGSSGVVELEDIGNRYFMELFDLGVFVEPLFDFRGNRSNQQAISIHSCEIHPCMHKLAREITHNEVWVINSSEANKDSSETNKDSFETIESPMHKKRSIFKRFKHSKLLMQSAHERTLVHEMERRCTTHLALHEDLQSHDWGNRFNLQTGVKTCLFFVPEIQIQSYALRGASTNFSELQILDLSGIQFEELPASLREGNRLRYLGFSRNTLLKRIDWSPIQLQTLAIDGCVQLEKVNIEYFSHMRHLYYTSKESTLEICTYILRILQFSYCSELKLLSLRYIGNSTALRILRFFECPRLVSLPDDIDLLPCVEELVFHNCALLDLNYGRSMNSLPSLQHMELIGLPKLTKLPAGLQSAKTLNYLMIENCLSLRSLDHVLHLATLQKLHVYDCPTLFISPNGFQSLTALQSLDIKQCPNVTTPSTSDAGKHKAPFISHISEITLDGQQVLFQAAAGLPGGHDAAVAAQTDSLPRNLPHFILSLESFTAIKSSEGMLYHKYKLKVPSRWFVIALALRAILNMRVLHQQGVYSCLFAIDYEFEKDTLVQIWMARGLFLEPREHLANKRFKWLLEENYINESREDNLTGITKYKINVGKVTALSNRLKREDLYTLIEDEDTTVDGSTSWHHVSVVSKNIDEKVFQTLEKLGELRSVVFICDYGSSLKQIPYTFFTALPYMQVLDLSGSHISELPSSLGKMTQLRFLDLSFTLIERIPESIHLLQELQTLKLKGCKHLHKLPKGMKMLINLYHLDFDVLGQLTSMPKRLGYLTKLRTLSAFIVSKEKGCKISELKDLNNLCGSLCISGLEYIEGASEAAMQDKSHLTRLHLKWNESTCYDHQGQALANIALVDLKPHPFLKQLQISYCPGSRVPGWLQNPENLVSITLVGCKFEKLFNEEEFPINLKHLNIYDMNELREWVTRSPNPKSGDRYQRLETLTIDRMRSLERWVGVNIGDFQRLSKLSIKHCPKLPRLPFLIYPDSLKYLEISHCQSLKWQLPRKLPTSLDTLMINKCPSIKARCSEGGEDWELIKHVANIWIDMKDIHAKHNATEDEDESGSSDDESESYGDESD